MFQLSFPRSYPTPVPASTPAAGFSVAGVWHRSSERKVVIGRPPENCQCPGPPETGALWGGNLASNQTFQELFRGICDKLSKLERKVGELDASVRRSFEFATIKPSEKEIDTASHGSDFGNARSTDSAGRHGVDVGILAASFLYRA